MPEIENEIKEAKKLQEVTRETEKDNVMLV